LMTSGDALMTSATSASTRVGPCGYAIGALGAQRTLAQLQAEHPAGWCETQWQLYHKLLKPYATDQGRLLDSLSLPATADQCFEYSDGRPLCLDGSNVGVDTSNRSWFKLLWLMWHVFGSPEDDAPATCGQLLGGLCRGLHAWGRRVFSSLVQLSDAELVAELEGCLRVTPQMFLSNVRYADSTRPCDVEWFERAVEATEEATDHPILSLPTLLMFITGMATFRADGSLRPAKQDPSRQFMLIVFEERRKAPCVRTCFYELYLPCYASYEELLADIQAHYTHESFDQM